MPDCRPPSPLLRGLRFATRRGWLRSGYWRLLRSLPDAAWGGSSVTVPTEAGPMCLPVDEPSATELLLFGRLRHEETETRVVRRLAPRLEAALDVGAHYGWYSRLLGEGTSVLSFEPGPSVYPFLRQNVRRLSSVEAIPVALGDRVDTVTLWQSDTLDRSSVARQVGRPVTVEARTLDGVLEDHGLDADTVGFVKCDVEGGERTVVDGAGDLLEGSNRPIWMVEVSWTFAEEAGWSVPALLADFVRDEDDRWFRRADPGLERLDWRDPVPWDDARNLFFVPAGRRDQFHEALRPAIEVRG